MKELTANKYDYDSQSDSVFFYGTDKEYEYSIDLDGIIIDFSEDKQIMGVEILDASKKFNLSKSDLHNIKHFNALIEITKNNIDVSMKIEVSKRNKLDLINIEWVI
ncbi:DUF2283 domain-containing protein [Methanococcoides sp. NM1]|uniref:DUF2283 domain-containing protein n=1 Tax=Methanococcoides sp. NM1 TaxID=1201013 RepID=UPI001083FCC0|nr:DUF2283 domain-containing protein [Methanococcoides sp. NM1]